VRRALIAKDLGSTARRCVDGPTTRAVPAERLLAEHAWMRPPPARLPDCERRLVTRARLVTQSIAELTKRYDERLEKHRKAGAVDPRLEDFRWALEELRVSLFAQELKTPYPVSYKRLEKMWNAMR